MVPPLDNKYYILSEQGVTNLVYHYKLKKGVNDVIEQLASVAQENAASTEETSASMQSLANNVDLCKEESAILNDLSKNINEQTSRFKF